MTNATAINAAPEFFVSQWGYEQTNVCFYKVLKRTAKTVTLIEVQSNREYLDAVNYTATPVDEPLRRATPIRRKLQKWSDRECAGIRSFETAFAWKGERVEGSSGY